MNNKTSFITVAEIQKVLEVSESKAYRILRSLNSELKKEGLIDSAPVEQDEVFRAMKLFACAEGIIPAPESSHAIALAIREALLAKEEGTNKVILFNLSGHGLLDLLV